MNNQIIVSKFNPIKLKEKLFESFKQVKVGENNKLNVLNPLIEKDATDYERSIASIFCSILGCQNLSKYNSFFELGGNSISAIRLITTLNNEFSTNFPFSLIFKYDTVNKLSFYIDNKLNLKNSLYIPIVKLNYDYRKQNIFMVHPGLSGCEVYISLANRLKEQFSCYGVDSFNLYNESKIDNLNQLAQYYLMHIEAVMNKTNQVEYNLLGWSLGGKISLEIAYILEQKGIRKINVFLLDPVIPDDYLLSITKEEDTKLTETTYRTYAVQQGYEESYITRVIPTIHTENMLGRQQVSGILMSSNIILFKAMLQGIKLNSNAEKEIYTHLIKLKYNNLEKIVEKLCQIELIEISNANHHNMLECSSFLASTILTSYNRVSRKIKKLD